MTDEPRRWLPRLRRRDIAALVVAAILLVGSVVAFWTTREVAQRRNPERARAEGRPIPVRTAQVVAKEVEEVMGATGVTEPSASAGIYVASSRGISSSDLVMKNVHVWEGKEVARGDVLFELDDQVFQLAVASAQAHLRFRNDDLARLEKDRARFEVLSSRDFISQLEYTEFLTALFEARYRKVEAENSYAVALRDLESLTIRSPIDGVADLVTAVPEQVLPDNLQLTTVHTLDPLHVRVDFPPERTHLLGVDSQLEVVLDSMPQRRLPATVVSVAPRADEQTRALPVVVEIDNSDLSVRAGVGAFVRFRLRKSAVVVPSVSVIDRSGRAMVFVVEDGTARIREIQLGPVLGPGERELRGGLEPGARVVVFGHEQLNDGERVDADWTEWAQRDR